MPNYTLCNDVKTVRPCQEPSQPECPDTPTTPLVMTTTPSTPSSTSCDCTGAPDAISHTTHTETSMMHHPDLSNRTNITAGVVTDSKECPAASAVTLALAGMSSLLLLILLSIVIGWVWSCHRKKKTRY